MPTADIVVIGSGLSGLAFTRFYLEIHPEADLWILEEDKCLGGVWAQATKYVTEYLEDYAHYHKYDGRTLHERVYFQHRACKIRKAGDLWHVTTISPTYLQERHPQDRETTWKCAKLVVATGRTSSPKIPSINWNREDPRHSDSIRHHKDFGELSQQVFPPIVCNRKFVILGGGKSAADMVYELVKKGQPVSWIIRKSGEGPALPFPAPGHGRYKNSVESSATRLKSLFSPSPFMPKSWWFSLIRTLIYGTSIGIKYMLNRINNVNQYCRNAAGYETRPGALPTFSLLDFTTSAFWCTGPVGLMQHEDFWDTIAKNVTIYRNDIVSYSDNIISLDDGTKLHVDEFLLGTGWKDTTHIFFSQDQVRSLGLPHCKAQDTPPQLKIWDSLREDADKEVIYKFPILEQPPPHRKPTEMLTAQSLYKGIVPLEDKTIAFLRAIDVSNSFRTAETQAIWTTAYFDDNINLPPLEERIKEVAYMQAFSKRRYPTHGQKGDCFFFELIWYTDALLHEVGLKSHRKGLWADWVKPCLASDLKGMKNEYKKKFGV